MHTLTIYTYFSTMRVTNVCPGKILEFQIRKGLLLQAEGGISWWMGWAKLRTSCPRSGPCLCFYCCMRLVWPGLVYLGTESEFTLRLKPFLSIASELWEQHFQSPSDVLAAALKFLLQTRALFRDSCAVVYIHFTKNCILCHILTDTPQIAF